MGVAAFRARFQQCALGRYGSSIALVCLYVFALCLADCGFAPPAAAKTPGETHCYKKICHRVKTIAETRQWIGRTMKISATHYDHPSIDRYNTGKYTSSGEVFDAGDPTRASSSNLPDGTELLVWNPDNGRTVHVRVNDFGPFHTDRKLDLTRAAAEELGFAQKGVADLEVIILAVPPLGEPAYQRGRRYPAALGFLGVLASDEVAALVDRVQRNLQLNRMASIDIHQFLWSIRMRNLRPAALVAVSSLPPGGVLKNSRDVLTILPYAKASADPHYPRPSALAGLDSAREPASAPALLKTASYAGAGDLNASMRPVSFHDDSPARFALRLPVAERAGWRVPPSLEISDQAARATEPLPLRLATLSHAPIVPRLHRAYQYATADIDSIRWSVPGLDMLMRAMTPVWGANVSPPQALQAVVGTAVMLMFMTLVGVRRAIIQQRGGPVRVPVPLQRLDVTPLRPRAVARRRAPPQPHLAANVTPFDLERFVTRTEQLTLPTRPRPSVIERGLQVDGLVESNGEIVVAGTVVGECRCHTLVINVGGRVDGNIIAVRVVIKGRFKGAIDAASIYIDEDAEIDYDIDIRTPDRLRYCEASARRPYAIAAE
ncbi:MAG: polymer-forming cytoskeletal protein [Alphaproteobacteria bacterium]|nr:polymer-forming cytoskeletal protein [Alphaproteobacteria bacterium]